MPPGADAVAQARALLGQLRTLAAQHEQVLAAYERQLDVITAGGSAKVAQLKAPNKRPLGLGPADAEGPEAKKQRLVAEQQQRRNALWHECYKVLDRCRRNQKAEAFKKPVDPIRMKIPDYPLLVKNPMDLQTVGEKLKLRVYKDPAEFAADMRLIWDNAVIYNGRTHVVGLAAQAMSEFFEKAWGPLQVDKQWGIMLKQEDLAREALQGNTEGLPNSDLPRQLKEKRDMLGHYIAARDFNEGVPPGSLGPFDPARGMNFEEKRKLSAHLASLPGEKMQRVVDIVEAGLQNPPTDADGELEVDIDTLPDAVLWQLKEYVDAVLAPPAAPPKKGGASKGAASKAPDKRPPHKGGAAAKGGAPNQGPATKGAPNQGGSLGGGAQGLGGAVPASGVGTPIQGIGSAAARGSTPTGGTPPPAAAVVAAALPSVPQLAAPEPPAAAVAAGQQQQEQQQQQQQQHHPEEPSAPRPSQQQQVADKQHPPGSNGHVGLETALTTPADASAKADATPSDLPPPAAEAASAGAADAARPSDPAAAAAPLEAAADPAPQVKREEGGAAAPTTEIAAPASEEKAAAAGVEAPVAAEAAPAAADDAARSDAPAVTKDEPEAEGQQQQQQHHHHHQQQQQQQQQQHEEVKQEHAPQLHHGELELQHQAQEQQEQDAEPQQQHHSAEPQAMETDGAVPVAGADEGRPPPVDEEQPGPASGTATPLPTAEGPSAEGGAGVRDEQMADG